MSVLLGLAFACLAAIAISAMVASLKRCTPFVTELRSELREPPVIEELHLTVQMTALPTALPISDSARPKHEPKPIKQLLNARKRSAALT